DGCIGPSWSPDGRQIAFVSSNSLDVINSDGSNRRALFSLPIQTATSGPVLPIYSPQWSPDGSRFLFEFGQNVGGLDSVAIDGLGLREIRSWDPAQPGSEIPGVG